MRFIFPSFVEILLANQSMCGWIMTLLNQIGYVVKDVQTVAYFVPTPLVGGGGGGEETYTLNCFFVQTILTNRCIHPGREKVRKICKISGEKIFFFTANFVQNFAVKCGEIM